MNEKRELLERWNKGAKRGEFCNCQNKIVLEKGDSNFIAWVTYCSKHGFDTSCWLCAAPSNTTESCSRDHLAVYGSPAVWLMSPKAKHLRNEATT